MIRSANLGLALASLALNAVAASLPQQNDPYFRRSEQRLEAARQAPPIGRRARNVILFIGDGMGPSTVTAARILAGQSAGRDGPSNELAFERFPFVALSKTYSHDEQVTDSAAGATGLMAGVKTRSGVVGLDSRALRGRCDGSHGAEVLSIAEVAKMAGLSTGVVTTTSLTDATPAAAYGHVADRDWEDDASMPSAATAAGCVDLARQLIEAAADRRLDVALGGGRARFTPVDIGGDRRDGRNLLERWLADRPRSRVARTAEDLNDADDAPTDHLLGVFAPNHLSFHQKAPTQQPSLAQMTTAALEILARNPKGYFLMVEGGLIDKASHLDNAARTLDETVQFSKAIEAALSGVNLNDTLVIVTADHSHGLVLSGGASRDAPILGLAQVDGQAVLDAAGRPYTILSFASGPSALDPHAAVSQAEALQPEFRQPALVPMRSAEHGGEDVAVYATGPGSDLVRGVVEQPYVFQVILAALGLAP